MTTSKTYTKMDLFKKVQDLEQQNKKLMMAIGQIRNGIQAVVFPHEHRETMDEVMKRIDSAIDRI